MVNMNNKKNNRKQRKEEKEKVNKISNLKLMTLINKNSVITFIVVMLILGAIIFGLVYNIRKGYTPQETADNKKENVNYIWGEIKPGKKNENNYTMVTSADGIQVPVPTRYTASSVEDERYVNGGFVIYEGTDDVTTSNQWEAQCNRNQYAWIPITDVSDMYWRDQTTGKKYGTRYFINGIPEYSKNVTLKNEPQTTDYDIQSTYLTQYLNGMSREDFLMEMEIDFDKMLNSVATYGGFYIGRYETGDLSQATPVIKRINTDIGDQTWYTMWKKARKLSGTSAGVQMIWGTQWDQTLKWLVDTEKKTLSEVGYNSTSWGNYESSSFTYYKNTSKNTARKSSGVVGNIPSGSYEGANANNVYDLAGNMWEWTNESDNAGKGDTRYGRGGSCCYYRGDHEYASNYELYEPNTNEQYGGMRCSLFIK